jgi:hypothetical protein
VAVSPRRWYLVVVENGGSDLPGVPQLELAGRPVALDDEQGPEDVGAERPYCVGGLFIAQSCPQFACAAQVGDEQSGSGPALRLACFVDGAGVGVGVGCGAEHLERLGDPGRHHAGVVGMQGALAGDGRLLLDRDDGGPLRHGDRLVIADECPVDHLGQQAALAAGPADTEAHGSAALRARNLLGVSAGCHQMRTRTTMTPMAMVYRRPAGVTRQSVKPQLASWDRAGHPSQVKLARFLAHVDAIAGPVLATVSGRVAAELIVGFSDSVSLIDGGHDLDNYLFPVAQRLGPERVAAIFGRKVHGPSSLAVGPAQPDTAEAAPQFSTRMAG